MLSLAESIVFLWRKHCFSSKKLEEIYRSVFVRVEDNCRLMLSVSSVYWIEFCQTGRACQTFTALMKLFGIWHGVCPFRSVCR